MTIVYLLFGVVVVATFWPSERQRRRLRRVWRRVWSDAGSTKTSPDRRNRGLRRISLVTRAVAVGALVLSGVFTTLVAWGQPGRANGATAGNNRSRATRRRTTTTTAASSTTDPYAGDALAPAANPPYDDSGDGPVIVSGQS
jgi:hypothetical protein